MSTNAPVNEKNTSHTSHDAPSLPSWTDARWVAAILLIFVGLGLWYSLVVPPFESPDELYHYAFARHVALGYDLPVQSDRITGPWEQEGSQAPLYYFLVGGLIAGIDQGDFDQINAINPHANLGNPLYLGNKNHLLFSTLDRPLVGTNLALHVGRWFSLLLGSLTLLLTYGLARLAFPSSRSLPLYALAVVATIPQFIFISASVSNDNMVVLMSAAVLYWLARLTVRRSKAPIAWWEWGVLGLLVGLGALSKLHGLGLIGLALVAIVLQGWRRPEGLWRGVVLPVGLVVILAGLVAGWWYWRNYTLYGDWLGVQHLLRIEGERTVPQTLAGLWGELRGLRYSFWGLFGWFSILLPQWIYHWLDAVSMVALTGAVVFYPRGWWRQRAPALDSLAAQVHLLVLIWVTVSVGLIAYWIAIAQGSQGRLLFPAISGFGVLLTLGLDYWGRYLGRPWRTLALGALPIGLIAVSFYVLLFLLPASYRASDPVSAVPASAQPVGKVYGDSLELVAVDLPDGRYQPGDVVPITLYLRATAPQTDNNELFVQLLDQENLPVGNVTTHPGWGRNPTSLWQPGAIYADTYAVAVWNNISNRSPLQAKVYVGFADAESGALVPVQGAQETLASRIVGSVLLEPSVPLNPRLLDLSEVNTRFGGPGGEVIQLAGYRILVQHSDSDQRRVPVSLYWRAVDVSATDYTAFVHLIDSAGGFVAGYDQPPAEGRYPTRLWQPGDGSLSDFIVPLSPDLPAGTYEIWVGLYDGSSDNLDRLPILDSDRPTQDNRVLLGTAVLP